MKDTLQIVLLLAILGLVIGERRPQRPRRVRKLIMDSCGLIDGRIVELSRSGFISDELIVPDFVLYELQLLADGADSHKRSRARFGLDVVKQLQTEGSARVTIDRSIKGSQPTDTKLLALAKKLHARVYTTDFNLNKLAEVEGVQVMNINELAHQLRPVAIPGERQEIKILQKGSNPKQGVGYLEDGTMVVVDNAARRIGKTVTIEITRTHQTLAGKMLFATIAQPLEKRP